MDRNKRIIRTSIIGIASNVFLAVFKAIIGVLSKSVAIVMDAVNNLSDALSSVITILGTKLSERPADRMHPYGYGRVEYFSAIIISIIVIMAGITSLIESVKKIFNPTVPEYSTATLIIIVAAIIVKLVLGRYVKAEGKRLKSDSLIASGSDALFDAIITLSTLVAAVIMLLWNFSIDGYLGTAISLLIIKSGIEMLQSPINELLGSRVSEELVRNIKEDVAGFDGVEGVHDLIIHTYGPETMIGSLHVTVPDTITASRIHFLDRKIAECLYAKYGVIATVGIYADNTGDTPVARMQRDVLSRAAGNEGVLGAHAFYVDFDSRTVSIDVLIDYDVKDADDLKNCVMDSLKKVYPDYSFDIVIDYNYSD